MAGVPMPWDFSWQGGWYGRGSTIGAKPVSSSPRSWRSSEELADVPCRIGDGAGIGVRQVEHLAVLGLQGVGARGRGAHDPIPGARERRQRGEVAAGLLRAVLVEAVVMNGRPQHSWRGTMTLNPLRSRTAPRRGRGRARSRSPRSRGSRRRSSRDRARLAARGATAPPPPRAEGPARERRQRPAPMDPEDFSPIHRASRSGAEVGEWRERVADADHEIGVADEPVAEARAAVGDDRGAGAVVRLGDEHACGHARVQIPQPEHRSTVRSASLGDDGPRKRSACGPTYFGPERRRSPGRPGRPWCTRCT